MFESVQYGVSVFWAIGVIPDALFGILSTCFGRSRVLQFRWVYGEKPPSTLAADMARPPTDTRAVFTQCFQPGAAHAPSSVGPNFYGVDFRSAEPAG